MLKSVRNLFEWWKFTVLSDPKSLYFLLKVRHHFRKKCLETQSTKLEQILNSPNNKQNPLIYIRNYSPSKATICSSRCTLVVCSPVKLESNCTHTLTNFSSLLTPLASGPWCLPQAAFAALRSGLTSSGGRRRAFLRLRRLPGYSGYAT